MPALSSRRLKEQARALGFNLAGVTPARPARHLDAYFAWLEAGRHGAMNYLAREDRLARRRDLNAILPGARALVIVGLDYHNLSLPESLLGDPARGRIALYAWGRDYHALMLPRLEALAGWLRAEAGVEVRHRAYVDTGALLERGHAQAAGLGFIGKNTLLIHPRRGSNFFLGEIVTDTDFDAYDEPGRETQCGTCARCLTACPTAAFPRPYVLDARRCISYLTIEHPGALDPALRPLMGNWVFGCDVCQTVCPWQRFGVQTLEADLLPLAPDRAAPPLAQLLALDAAGFEAQFRGTALHRLGRDGLARNACVAAGNSGRPQLIEPLAARLADASPLVRGHAAWALGRLRAQAALAERLPGEADESVRAEIAAALAAAD